MKLITNKLDDESLIRIINYPARGIGKTSIERIREFASLNVPIIVGNEKEIKKTFTLEELLPYSFGPENLV